MTSLLNKTPAAIDWVKQAIRRHTNGIFGKIVPAVIWTDARDEGGELLVPVDPGKLSSSINNNPYILLLNHDPGRPIGQLLESAVFEDDAGRIFVAAILGYYAGGDVLSFREFGLDVNSSVSPPEKLPALSNDIWIQVATDPREVDEIWLNQATLDAPLRVTRTELSHNAEDSAHELIKVGLVYVLLVWNPFITSVATEAGKATFAATHAWLRSLLGRLADRRNPILDIQASQDDCQVSFLFRGKDVKTHYAAHDTLSNAAAQAAQLIKNLRARGVPARELKYEFSIEAGTWFPSFAILADSRIISDSSTLIAVEQLPAGLSLGLSRGLLFPGLEAVATTDGETA